MEVMQSNSEFLKRAQEALDAAPPPAPPPPAGGKSPAAGSWMHTPAYEDVPVQPNADFLQRAMKEERAPAGAEAPPVPVKAQGLPVESALSAMPKNVQVPKEEKERYVYDESIPWGMLDYMTDDLKGFVDFYEGQEQDAAFHAKSAVEGGLAGLPYALMAGASFVAEPALGALFAWNRGDSVWEGAVDGFAGGQRAINRVTQHKYATPPKVAEFIWEDFNKMSGEEKAALRERAKRFERLTSEGKMKRGEFFEENADILRKLLTAHQENEGGEATAMLKRLQVLGRAVDEGIKPEAIAAEAERYGLPQGTTAEQVRREVDLFHSFRYSVLRQSQSYVKAVNAYKKAKEAGKTREIAGVGVSMLNPASWLKRGADEAATAAAGEAGDKVAGRMAKVGRATAKGLGALNTISYPAKLAGGALVAASILDDDGRATVREAADTAGLGAGLMGLTGNVPLAAVRYGAGRLKQFVTGEAKAADAGTQKAFDLVQSEADDVLTEAGVASDEVKATLPMQAATGADPQRLEGIAPLIRQGGDKVAAEVAHNADRTTYGVGMAVTDNTATRSAAASDLHKLRHGGKANPASFDGAAKKAGQRLLGQREALEEDVRERFYRVFDEDFGGEAVDAKKLAAADLSFPEKATLADLKERYAQLGSQAAKIDRSAPGGEAAFGKLTGEQRRIYEFMEQHHPDAYAKLREGDERFRMIARNFRPAKTTKGANLLRVLQNVARRDLNEVGDSVSEALFAGRSNNNTAQRFVAVARALSMGQNALPNQVLADSVDWAAGSKEAARVLVDALSDADVIKLNTRLRYAEARALPNEKGLQEGLDIIAAEGMAALDRIAKGAAKAPNSPQAGEFRAMFDALGAEDIYALREAAVARGMNAARVDEFMQGAALRAAFSEAVHLDAAANTKSVSNAIIGGFKRLLADGKEAEAKFDALFPAVKGQKTTPRARFEYMLAMVAGADYLRDVVARKGLTGDADFTVWLKETHGVTLKALRPFMNLPVSQQYTAASTALSYLRRYLENQNTEKKMARLTSLIFADPKKVDEAVENLSSDKKRAVWRGLDKMAKLMGLGGRSIIMAEGAGEEDVAPTREDIAPDLGPINQPFMGAAPAMPANERQQQ